MVKSSITAILYSNPSTDGGVVVSVPSVVSGVSVPLAVVSVTSGAAVVSELVPPQAAAIMASTARSATNRHGNFDEDLTVMSSNISSILRTSPTGAEDACLPRVGLIAAHSHKQARRGEGTHTRDACAGSEYRLCYPLRNRSDHLWCESADPPAS